MKLTKKEKKTILKALIFTGNTDCCLSDNENEEGYIELATKLSKEFKLNDLTDTNLYIFDGAQLNEPELVEKIKENFKVRFEE